MTEPDLDALFDSERTYEETPSPEVRLRARNALLARLAVAGGGSGNGDGGGGGSAAAGEATGNAAGAPATATISVTGAVAGMIGTLILGAVLGAAAMHRAQSESVAKPPAIATAPGTAEKVVAAVPPAASVAPPADSAILAPRDLSSTPTAKMPPGPVESIGPESARGIAAERALVDAARIALANGEAAETLSLLDRHEREFRRGRLTEEREALAIRALVKAGRYDEARARGSRFASAWPRSLAMPAVTGALESIP